MEAAGLFSPMRLREVVLRNRIVVSPMLTYCANGGHLNDYHFVHYGRFATGGAGLVFVESTKMDPRGCSTPRDLGLWKDEYIAPFRKITDFIHAQGAAVGIQIGHSGRKARRPVPWEGRLQLDDACPGVDHGEPWELIAPSAIAHDPHYAVPRAMTAADIEQALENWRRVAGRVLQAGFDVMEIHGAHGYLIHQFLSPVANRRNDDYGGTFEKRMRFDIDVAKSVRQVWPAEKPLFFRMSCVDDTGWELEHSIELARRLGEAGVDVIDCSAGGMTEGSVADLAPTYGYQVQYAAQIREHSGVATMAVGLIVHPDQADDIIRSGQADLAALGREILHNPNWPLDAAQKLGVASLDHIPKAYAYWLEKRAKTFKGKPSTWQKGMEKGPGSE